MPKLSLLCGLQPSSPLALLLLALAAGGLVAGTYARWAILSDRPLAVDEYYFVQSVRQILEHGVPVFETGGYYARGLPLQYLTASAVLAVGESLLAYRLPTFLFSLLSVVLTFLYARRFVSPAVALAVATALLVSSWHIEFAGFVRMYAMLQCIVLLFLIAIDDAFFWGHWQRRYIPHGLALVAVFSHAIGITLTPLLFLPLLAGGPPGGFRSFRARAEFALAGIATSLICMIVVKADLRNFGVENTLPVDYSSGSNSPINLPVFPFWELGAVPTLGLGLVLAGLLAGGLWLLHTRDRRVTVIDGWLLTLVLLSFIHLFALALIPFLVLLLRYDVHLPARHDGRTYLLLALAVVAGVAWLTYGLASWEFLTRHAAITQRWDLSTSSLVKALWTTFFGWPDISRTTIKPFLEEMPLLGLLLLAALAVALFVHRHDPVADLLRLPWLVLVVTILIYGVIEGPYSRLRYWYHLYPVMLCVIALAVSELVLRVTRRRPALRCHVSYVSAFGFLTLFGLLSDFDPAHIAGIREDAVTFRTGPFEERALTWYQRYDYRTPAAFMNAQPLKATSRVVVEYQYPVSFDLKPPHAIYIPRTWHDLFPLHSRVRGTVDVWANQPLLSTPEELAAYTRHADEVWLIRGTDRSRPELPEPKHVLGARLLEQSRVLLSRDGRIEVLRLTLAPPA